MTAEMMSLAEYAEKAEAWMSEHAERRSPEGALRWGVGSDHVAVFHNLSLDEERSCIDELRAWQRLKSDAGNGSISWPVEYGGAGLPRVYEAEFSRLGPRLTADTGEWGTFAWTQLVNGAPGMRLGGGTDEIQRNTIAERVLGLPREPR